MINQRSTRRRSALARYRHYGADDIKQNALFSGHCEFVIFTHRDCDMSVLEDEEVTDWVFEQGLSIEIDANIWTDPALSSPREMSYPHAMVVDSSDSAVLLVRDPIVGFAFKMKFC